MTETEVLLEQIRIACRELAMAQTTFGRLAVNDGKLVNRLEQGGHVTLRTVERVHAFIAAQGKTSVSTLRAAIPGLSPEMAPEHNFRFYDNRQKYLMFVSTSSEKQIIADMAIAEVGNTRPRPPALRLFDGGTGDGTALARVLRGLHWQYQSLPFYIVAKEISMENVRLALEKMADRFQEHPATVLVITNMKYAEAPWLRPNSEQAANIMVRKDVVLRGSTAGDFDQQIAELMPFLRQHWQASISPSSGNPVYQKPAVLVLYREDQRFLIEQMLPRPGAARADFDLVLLSQPYRSRASLDFKAGVVVAPLVQALAPHGRLLGIHSHGNDPGLEIIRAIWPDENPFETGRSALMGAVKSRLRHRARDYRFHALPDSRALFRYSLHALPSENSADGEPGTSTLFGAWNAATYVAQIEDRRLATAMTSDHYLDVTREILRRHNGLWFNDERYIISRQGD